MLQRKYDKESMDDKRETPSFLQMQGILKGEGNAETDRLMMDEYEQEIDLERGIGSIDK